MGRHKNTVDHFRTQKIFQKKKKEESCRITQLLRCQTTIPTCHQEGLTEWIRLLPLLVVICLLLRMKTYSENLETRTKMRKLERNCLATTWRGITGQCQV